MLEPHDRLIAQFSFPYSASPSWHRNLRRRRARARAALRVADTPGRVNNAAQLIAHHHGSQLPSMGKWWRCRQCGWFSERHQDSCGACGGAYQHPPSAAASGISPAARNSANHKAAAVTAAPSAVPRHGRGRWGHKFAARKKSMPRTEAPQDVDADMSSADQTEDHIETLKTEMSTLNHVISSLKGRSDDSAKHILTSAQGRLKQLRIEVTRSKPLAVQLFTVQDLVDRRWEACQVASQAHHDAQAALL